MEEAEQVDQESEDRQKLKADLRKLLRPTWLEYLVPVSGRNSYNGRVAYVFDYEPDFVPDFKMRAEGFRSLLFVAHLSELVGASFIVSAISNYIN